MNYLLKRADGTLEKVECTPAEESLCRAFCEKYAVCYHSLAEGLYGSEMVPVTLSEHRSYSPPDKMLCILSAENGEKTVIGCSCEGREYWLNGQKEYSRTTAPGPQDALIYDYNTWTLVERKGEK